MEGSIRLTDEDRKNLLQVYRSGNGGRVVHRAQILLLLADGLAYREVRRVVFCSFDLISECVQRFRAGGVAGVLDQGPKPVNVPLWLARVAQWLLTRTPRDFGYFRSRWSCQTLAEVLAWETGERMSSETIRRGLERLGFVWRRPRPVVGPVDPEFERKLAAIRDLIARLLADETVVFQDEVDVHLNPKIGSAWMVRGHQSEVITPGNNQKRHVAGSLHWRTGTLLVSPPGRKRNAKLFVAHLDDLRQRLRGYRKIHVICDNATFHGSRLVQEYLYRWRGRIELHFLPKYAPETNPIERVWWRMHEEITRNHRCQTLDELLNEVYTWFQTQEHFYSKSLALYAQSAA
jgi:putative transposase